MNEKPHKGKIVDWVKVPVGDRGEVVFGRAIDHPEFAGHSIRTSFVVSHDEATGEIETRNSRYTLVGSPTK